MRWIKTISFLFAATLAFSQETDRQAPAMKFSKELKYTVGPMPSVTRTRVQLTSSESDIFLQSPEVLETCAARRDANAVVVEIQGFDHDYFTVVIVINKDSFQAKFSLESDHIEETVNITPKEVSLKLKDSNFEKGRTITGALRMTAACQGGPCHHARFNIEGNFVFTCP